jgi:F-type H+-transporting ATPase subunit c
MDTNNIIAVGVGIAVLTGCGAGVGIGVATSGLLQSISRQPEMRGQLLPLFFLGAALSEATAIYGLVFAIILLGKLG